VCCCFDGAHRLVCIRTNERTNEQIRIPYCCLLWRLLLSLFHLFRSIINFKVFYFYRTKTEKYSLWCYIYILILDESKLNV
jgi:hypothetical protein